MASTLSTVLSAFGCLFVNQFGKQMMTMYVNITFPYSPAKLSGQKGVNNIELGSPLVLTMIRLVDSPAASLLMRLAGAPSAI
jgi:hypothetical protein